MVRCNYHCIDSNVCLLSNKPKSVAIIAVNATAVNISWSGSIHLNTCLHYTVHCSSTGSVMSRYATALVPGVNWALVNIRDDITLGFQYRHDFTLYYFYSATNVVDPPLLQQHYLLVNIVILAKILCDVHWLQIRSTFRFNLDPLITVSTGK